MAEEKEDKTIEVSEGETKREIDLNALYPGKELDLNRLFPDAGTRKLLHDVKRNKREIERFVRNLSIEEE
ncbi:MAG: hypothetical protein EHM36_09535 [Deltaproteobacteria bacterium]|nr:MAG: hypothetical protein EHM36_09535 [Deltaproteobacteria bacterium]